MLNLKFEEMAKELENLPEDRVRSFILSSALRLLCETENEMVAIEALKILSKGTDF